MKKSDTKKGFNFSKSSRNTRAKGELKISKTFRIDGDIFSWLVAEAGRTGIPYQTLMNAKLREAMGLPDRVKELVESVLRDKKAS